MQNNKMTAPENNPDPLPPEPTSEASYAPEDSEVNLGKIDEGIARCTARINTFGDEEGNIYSDEEAGVDIEIFKALQHERRRILGERPPIFGQETVAQLDVLDAENVAALPDDPDMAEGMELDTTGNQELRTALIAQAREDLRQKVETDQHGVLTDKVHKEMVAGGVLEADTQLDPQTITNLTDESLEYYLRFHVDKFDADRTRIEGWLPEFDKRFKEGVSELIARGDLPITEEDARIRTLGTAVEIVDFLAYEAPERYGYLDPKTGVLQMVVMDSKEEQLHIRAHEGIHGLQLNFYDWDGARVTRVINPLTTFEDLVDTTMPMRLPFEHRRGLMEGMVDKMAGFISGAEDPEELLVYLHAVRALDGLPQEDHQFLAKFYFEGTHGAGSTEAMVARLRPIHHLHRRTMNRNHMESMRRREADTPIRRAALEIMEDLDRQLAA